MLRVTGTSGRFAIVIGFVLATGCAEDAVPRDAIDGRGLPPAGSAAGWQRGSIDARSGIDETALAQESRHLGTASADQVLGFERAALWRGPGPVTTSSLHSQGTLSLAVRPHGYAVYRSHPFPLAPGALRQIALDIQLPPPRNPAPAGSLRMYLASRAKSLFARVGAADLTGRPAAAFTSLELAVPAAVSQRLADGADDLRIVLVLDVPRAPDVYLLDNLRLRTDLILHYSFDERSESAANGAVVDSSGYGRTGTLRGDAITTAAGRTGTALALEGSTSYLELPAHLTEGVHELTVAAWINLDEARGWSRLFDLGGASGFVFLTPSTPDALIRYSAFAGAGFEGIATAPSIPTGVWKHVAITSRGRDYRLYVDGVEAASALTIPVAPDHIGANADGNWIGRSRFPDPLLRGRVDDFRIYQRALDQPQIAALAQPQRDYAVWRFDERAGSRVADASGLQLSGTVTGGASFGPGVIDGAISLAGAGQHVALPPGIVAGCTDFSLAAWVKLRSNRPWNRIFEFGDFGQPELSSFMYLSPAGFGPAGQELRFGLVSPRGIDDVGFPFQLPLDEWTHLAVSLRGDTATLFVNGRPAVRQGGIRSRPSDMGVTTGNFFGRSHFADPSFDGSLDDIRLSCRGFDDREIAQLAHRPAPVVLPAQLPVNGDITDVHDPAILESGGQFWLFSTGPGLRVRSSADLATWRAAGPVFPTNPAWVTDTIGAIGSLWAPDISFFGGTHHLYYAASTFGSNRSCIGHATKADLNAATPWTDHGPLICSNVTSVDGPGLPPAGSAAGWQRGLIDDFNAIDPNMAEDTDGNRWLAFGSFWSGIKMVRLDPVTGARADAAVLDLASRPGDALEAPFIIHRAPYYYLFQSFDFCCQGANSSYRTVVGRSTSITGPYVDRTGLGLLQGGGTPVVTGNARWRGPGHNAILRRGDRYLNIYHSYDAIAGGIPTLRISELVWQDGWPVSAEP